MTEFDGLPMLRSPVLIAAFNGWNDAADAASNATAHLAEHWQAEQIAAVDPDPYYDFQVTRPTITMEPDGVRRVQWPTTDFSHAVPPGTGRDVVLLAGTEPNMHWRAYCNEILELCHSLEVEQVILLGALLSDVAYTQPLPVSGTSTETGTLDRLGLSATHYEGPTGIIGVLHDAAAGADLSVVSCWVHVPHYAASAPCPKATLALLHRLEELLDVPVPTGGLVEQTAEWEDAVTELAASDTDIAEYIKSLEDPDNEVGRASGDAIARDFERYLRRRGPGSND